MILGDVFLRNLHTTYDRENKTATFRQVCIKKMCGSVFHFRSKNNCRTKTSAESPCLALQTRPNVRITGSQSIIFQLRLVSRLEALCCLSSSSSSLLVAVASVARVASVITLTITLIIMNKDTPWFPRTFSTEILPRILNRREKFPSLCFFFCFIRFSLRTVLLHVQKISLNMFCFASFVFRSERFFFMSKQSK